MGLFDKFPYSNSHQLNLDWIIKAIKGDVPDTGEGGGGLSDYPYSNSHQLNLDWIITKMRELSERVGVFSVNGKTGDVRLTAADVEALPDTVKTLPNPQPLVFTGAVSASYDGKTRTAVNIPKGGSTVTYEGSGLEYGSFIGTLTIDGVQYDIWNNATTTSIDGYSGSLTLKSILEDAANLGVVELGNIANQGVEQSGKYLAVDSAGNIVLAPGGGSGGGAVDSVNGKTGIVVLNAEDVEAVPLPEIPTSNITRPLIYNSKTQTWSITRLSNDAFGPGTINIDRLYANAQEGDVVIVTGTSGAISTGKQLGTGKVGLNKIAANTADAGKFVVVGSDGTLAVTAGGTGGGEVTNPNMIDNPWFTVNQRGETSYSGEGYTVDRWISDKAGTTLNVVDNGIEIQNTSRKFGIVQKLDGSLAPGVYTLSVRIGNISPTATVEFSLQSSRGIEVLGDASGNGTFYASLNTSTPLSSLSVHIDVIGNGAATSHACTIEAVKLERSSVSTLAYDTAPNYATELLKCQRYQYVLDCPANMFLGMITTAQGSTGTKNFKFTLSTPVPLRYDIPALEWLSGDISNLSEHIGSNSRTATSLSNPQVYGNNLQITIATATSLSGFVMGYVYTNSAIKLLIDANL